MDITSPVSAASCLAFCAFVSGCALPMMPPSTGTKMSAMNSDADRVNSTVIGRNFMNSPTVPDQNSSGRNTASVVAVDAMIGHAMRLAAKAYASFGVSPSDSFRSASSTVTTAPSTSMPTTRMSENSTTMLSV